MVKQPLENKIQLFVSPQELAKSIDCTLLKPNSTEGDIRRLCNLAKKYNFASVFVNPCFVKTVASLLEGTQVRVGTVVAFPLGANTTTEKCFETINCIVNGANEIDFVLNIGYLKSRQYDNLFTDMKAVVVAAKRGQMKNPKASVITKVIFETCYLSEEEKRIACKVAERAGVDFVKTSTGFADGGATERDVQFLRRILPPSINIKASGGISSLADVNKFLELGASRIGTSSAAKIMEELETLDKEKESKE